VVSNNFSGIGRLTKDIEIRKAGDSPVCDFTIAINRFVKDKDHPMSDFIDCVAWNKTAENIEKFFHKGDRIAVSGRVQVDNYEDKDGVKRKSWKVQVADFDFIESKKSQSNTDTGTKPNSEVTDDSENPEDLPF
jgi:single-strand DNA-binding protein